MDTIDNTEDLVINTNHRWSAYCHKKSADGIKCSLYTPHEGLCKPKHGTEADRFEPVSD